MSSLQVANVWLESTANNRIQMGASNTYAFYAGGQSVLSVNSTIVTVGGSVQSSNNLINNQTANYTLANTDSGSVVLATNASSMTVTVPASVPVGFRTMVTRMGTGSVVIGNSAGVSLGSRTGAYTILNQYSSASVFMANSTFAIVDGNV